MSARSAASCNARLARVTACTRISGRTTCETAARAIAAWSRTDGREICHAFICRPTRACPGGIAPLHAGTRPRPSARFACCLRHGAQLRAALPTARTDSRYAQVRRMGGAHPKAVPSLQPNRARGRLHRPAADPSCPSSHAMCAGVVLPHSRRYPGKDNEEGTPLCVRSGPGVSPRRQSTVTRSKWMGNLNAVIQAGGGALGWRLIRPSFPKR